MSEQLGWLSDSFTSFKASQNGESGERSKAYQRFIDLGLPTKKDEAWKYTDLSFLERLTYGLPKTAPDSLTEKDIEQFFVDGISQNRLVFLDGVFQAQCSTLPEGLSLSGARKDSQSKVDEVLGSCASYQESATVALNSAFYSDGIFLALDGSSNEPIHVLYVASKGGAKHASFPRNVISLSDNAEATLVESYVSLGSKEYYTGVVSEIKIGKNARLEHYKIQLEGENATHVSSVHVKQSDDSRYFSYVFQFGGKLVRHEVYPELDGEGIDSDLKSLSALSGEQHVDSYVVMDHLKPNSESHELFRGVYDGKSRGVFSGTIIVRPDAQKTNAFQANNSLLLSPNASADSRPQLKIWADDVKCSHGATVGELDKDAMFYLKSRGLPQDKALRILIQAFAGEVLSTVGIDSLRLYLENCFLEKLG